MWQALKTCVEACHQGDLQLANAILEASNLSTPSGSLEVCYDERGYEYTIPNYCRLSPNELTASSSNFSQTQAQVPSPTSQSKSNKAVGEFNKKNSPAPLPVATPVPLTVRVRINPGEYNVKLTNLTTNDSILDLKNFISSLNSTSATAGGDKEEVGEKLVTAAVECLPPKGQEEGESDSIVPLVGAEGVSMSDENNNVGVPEVKEKKIVLPIVCEPTRQRVIFMGRELQNAQLLGDLGVDESKVVQIFLRPQSKLK
jgi:hypothetical protein